jgi:hypothetical protein
VGHSALDPELYDIRRRADGGRLVVHDVQPSLDDQASVLVFTDPQKLVQFELALGNGGNGPIVFQGSDDAEPRVVTAISLGSTDQEGKILLTFSEAIEEGATDVRFYKISDPDLEIRSVAFSTVGQPATTIELTTDPQRNQLYTVKVTNVKGRAGDFLVDPTRNLVSFYGIPPVDTTPPRLTSAVPSSNTEIILSFSEPLWPGADDPRNYVILCFDPFTATACPDLAITNSRLTMLGT